MSARDEESISALMDGELSVPDEAQAVDGLLGRAELRERWARYHMVRAVLRGELDAGIDYALQASVRRRLAGEPAHVLPVRRMRSMRRAIVAPAAGLALAASVATMAILGIRGENDAAPPRPVDVATVAAPETAAPARAATPATLPIRGEARPAAYDARQSRLNRYLVRHSEYLGGGMRGMLPYARIVGQEDSSGGR